ncbi:hemin uptake protein HemP [Salmonella enterica subsp. enterica serovar Choleraesuis]|nr:hemin uptake protein HemP [Salmonella enterica subsp. enterica serovar Choleraesuis]
MNNSANTHQKPLPNGETDASAPRQVDSKLLLGAQGRVVILHEGQQYLLRQTQAGKLILTK